MCRRLLALAVFAGLLFAADETPKTMYKFTFGAGKVPSDYTKVEPGTIYDKEHGYGFEPGSDLKATETSVTSDKPFYFSVAVPEGNYRVTATLGDGKEASVTTIKAELRRLMIEKVDTARGEFAKKTFIVNIRTPQIPGGGEVRAGKGGRGDSVGRQDDAGVHQ
jgi:fibronectin type 3 domain-containing protein